MSAPQDAVVVARAQAIPGALEVWRAEGEGYVVRYSPVRGQRTSTRLSNRLCIVRTWLRLTKEPVDEPGAVLLWSQGEPVALSVSAQLASRIRSTTEAVRLARTALLEAREARSRAAVGVDHDHACNVLQGRERDLAAAERDAAAVLAEIAGVM